jgi:hypothetical protein
MYKHPVNNLLKSQVPPSTVYDMAVVKQISSREQAYIHVSDRRETDSASKKTYPIKKRQVVANNQARKHPICQDNISGRIGHIKNKLSNLSEERRVEINTSSNHKRHKSDIVES